MLNLINLGMSFGSQNLFRDVNLSLLAKNFYGVTGANGTGKSTLLKLFAGEEQPSAGSVESAKKLSIGLLKQDHYRYEQDRIIDVVLKGKQDLWNALMEKEDLLTQAELTEDQGMHLAELEAVILDNDGYTAEARCQYILNGLGIKNEVHFSPLAMLSGGYKLRVLLAQLLFQAPDIMLLDEPTNHLDIVTISWLERFLKDDFKGLLIFVSHDHTFLNNMATHILDIDYGTITQYTGNFDKAMQAKEEVLAQKQHELRYKQEQISDMQRYADRFRASPSRSKQALSRLKMIDRMELPEIVDSSRIRPAFQFKMKHHSGKNLLSLTNISKSFSEQQILNDISFKIQRGQRCAIIGPNGIGKSTLLKILMGELAADKGSYEWNETADIAYFAQNFRANLPAKQTLLEWLEQSCDVNLQTSQIRQALGQMLFKGQDVDKQIGSLSGGEATRLMFAKIMLQQPNVLVLDEPTNHLDLEAIDALGDALHKFEGTLLLVSHNRHFVNAAAQRIIAISYTAIYDYLGSYDEFIKWHGDDYLQRINQPTV